MPNVLEHHRLIDGVRTRVLSGGADGGPTVLMLHGGAPGLSPFCGGTHLWGRLPDSLAVRRRVVLPDLLGSGGTEALSGPPTVDAMASHIAALATSEFNAPFHIVGHDLGGLVALVVAMERPELFASLTIVSSSAASPTGDGLENLTLLSPPRPLWSRQSQSWAYERLSYSHHHIDDALLSASEFAATQEGHRASVLDGPPSTHPLHVSIARAKSRFFAVAREGGVRVPTQIIWAKQDPLVGTDHGLWLHRIVAAKQPATQFHLINRSGSFPFREQPAEFLGLLLAFQDGLAADAARK